MKVREIKRRERIRSAVATTKQGGQAKVSSIPALAA
jgi:hypothetical protein